ncbi:MAG: esterase/lipase family protein [Oscillospiraceae bacterium]
MRFIAAVIAFVQNVERFAAFIANGARKRLGKHTDMVVRLLNYLLIIAGIASPMLFWLTNAPLWLEILLMTVYIIYIIVFCIYPSLKKYPTFRLRMLGDGAEHILTFFVTGTICLVFSGFVLWGVLAEVIPTGTGIATGVVLFLAELVIFWNGIIRVYCTSVSLGIKYRAWGIALGMVTPANLVVLFLIYRQVRRECDFEVEKAIMNKERRDDQVCRTKYPILLVHGVFFRDSHILNYWGRIPAELEANGAVIFYGEQQSAASVEKSATELAERIETLVRKTGCGRVNIIAHSKGGLDSRYAISRLGADKYVASLTTINTPHHGCLFAEYLLNNAPDSFVKTVENIYNSAFRRLGDHEPDFLAAVSDLTNSSCEEFNKNTPDMPGVMYRSVGSHARCSKSGRFPLNMSYPLVKKYDGDNDGLVALTSAPWGEDFTVLHPSGKRGITHADVIDLNRENIPGFDVREFYVQLVNGLKKRGL